MRLLRVAAVGVVLLGVLACRKPPVDASVPSGTTEYLGESTILEAGPRDESGIQQLALWRTQVDQKRLVCRVVVQGTREGDRVVSVMPTPIQSDAERPIADFVMLGNGWSPVWEFYVDQRGGLFTRSRGNKLTGPDDAGPGVPFDERAPFPEHLLGKKGAFDGYLLVTIEQNAPWEKVKAYLRGFAEHDGCMFGVGFEPAMTRVTRYTKR